MNVTLDKHSMERKNFKSPDENRTFEKGGLAVVNIAGTQIGLARFEPGWKWSECVKPVAQTDYCQVAHLAYIVQGKMRVRSQDGNEMEFGTGDAMALGPGHDAWIVGNEPCIVVDFVGAANYAKR